MSKQIPQEDIQKQLAHCREIASLHQGSNPLAYVDTYGCQQNEADSERLRGYMREMGYQFTDKEEEADLILINTCAIREHAEQKVLGNVGALVHVKARNPHQIICLCGCMMQQQHIADKIQQSYRHVDLVFGPQVLWKFPEFIHTLLTGRGRIFHIPEEIGQVAEGIPTVRQDGIRGWVSIMQGCNNFCTYCIVPYVRGRERSRKKEDILAEVTQMITDGYKEITLLGQNVNSYGSDLEEEIDFSDLLEAVNQIEGEFIIRFMTSHPKDANRKLFTTMKKCEKVASALHLPFQAGNNRVLEKMNRKYTAEHYLDLIKTVKEVIPEITLTSDIIVGFPSETTPEFEDTLTILEQVRFDALFTFLFSPRKGTPAEQMEDPIPKEEKSANFQRLVAFQNEISAQNHQNYVGRTMRCLVDGNSGDSRYPLTARTEGNRLVRMEGEETLIGTFQEVEITEANTWSLFGKVAQ
ncbi:MAG: tRNA (N6-isopentenyl adenosine(37)-C2)-methylthiotransferase MiaB [Eubacteriales bacterium]